MGLGLSALMLLGSADAGAQARKKHPHHTVKPNTTISAPAPAPNVSGEPAYLTAPVMTNAPTEAQPQQIQMNIKPQRRVRVVPAPPPPGPISPALPPKQQTTN